MAKIPSRITVPPLSHAMYQHGRSTVRQTAHDVIEAGYVRKYDALELALRSGVVIRIPRVHIRELKAAKPSDVAAVEIQPGGDGITFREIDVDIYVPGLLADELGSIFAKAMGRKTRGRTSTKKAATSRANGRKGGRPRKGTTVPSL